MLQKLFFASLMLMIVLSSFDQLCAQKLKVPIDTLVTIKLNDRSTLEGRVIQDNEDNIIIITEKELEVKVPKASIVSIVPIRGYVAGGKFYNFDPNYSRLIFGPTGRTLQKGDGFFFNYYVFFPGISYGFTDNISMTAGMSLFPGVSFENQVIYLAPRIGTQISDNYALSVGAIYFSVFDEFSIGTAFATGTIGHPDKSVTAGIGFGFKKEKGERFEFSEYPMIMLGGNIRVSNHTALVFENWFLMGKDFKLSEQPFGIALRFFGDHIAVDLGAFIIGELLDKGFPIPWLSFSYNF